MTFATIVIEDTENVEVRLRDFGITVIDILEIADRASQYCRDASPLMPANAPGLLAYIHGTEEMRRRFIEAGWEVSRERGVEAVVSHDKGLRVVFQNVDCAGDPNWRPHPRTAKGSGSSDLCTPNLFEAAGVELGPVPELPQDGYLTFFVMVDEMGGVELSCPTIRRGNFSDFRERIVVRRGSDDDVLNASDPPLDPVIDVDVVVSRKIR